MDIEYLVKNYLQNYDQLIDQLIYLFSKEEDLKNVLIVLHSEEKDKKWSRGVRFSELLKDNLFELFIESKLKLFSHKEEDTKKVSEELFGEELSLKRIFNNQENSIKVVLWSYLHLMVLMIEYSQKKKNKDKIKSLAKIMEDNAQELDKCKKEVQTINKTFGKDPKTMIKDILGIEVNDETNDMVDDIVKSFEPTLKGNNSDNVGISEMLKGAFDLSKKISEKYQDKIIKGDIQLDKLMEGIQKTIPGMDQMLKGGKMADMMKGMMSGEGGDVNGMTEMMKNMMGGAGGMADMMGAGGLMSGLLGKAEPKKETVIIDENFSTSNVEVGVLKEGSNINIGKMLNVANSLGVIPSFGTSTVPETPNIMDLFGMMRGVTDVKTKEEADALKAKVDNFMEKNLGLDMNKISKNMGKDKTDEKQDKTIEEKDKTNDEKDKTNDEKDKTNDEQDKTNEEIDKLMKDMD